LCKGSANVLSTFITSDALETRYQQQNNHSFSSTFVPVSMQQLCVYVCLSVDQSAIRVNLVFTFYQTYRLAFRSFIILLSD